MITTDTKHNSSKYLSNAPVTLKLGQGHWNWQENVKITGGYHHAKFGRSWLPPPPPPPPHYTQTYTKNVFSTEGLMARQTATHLYTCVIYHAGQKCTPIHTKHDKSIHKHKWSNKTTTLPPSIFFGGNLGRMRYGNRITTMSYNATKSL